MNVQTDRVELLIAAWEDRLAAVDRRLRRHLDAATRDVAGDVDGPTTATSIAAGWVRRGDAIDRLCRKLGLEPLDEAILVLALAPEIDARFAVALGALSGDPLQGRPSVGAALMLVAAEGQSPLGLRRRLRPGAPLIDSGAVALVPRESHGTELGAMLVPAPSVVAVATGSEPIDPELVSAIHRIQPPADFAGAACLPMAELASLLRRARGKGGLVLVDGELDLEGIAKVAAEVGWGAFRVDAARLAALPLAPAAAARRAALLARLAHAIVVIDDSDGSDARWRPAAGLLLQEADSAAVPVIMSRWAAAAAGGAVGMRTVAVACQPRPSPEERRQLWSRAVERAGARVHREDIAHVACRFRLAPPAIRAAAADAVVAASRRASGPVVVARAELVAAARRHTGSGLDGLAQKVPLRLRLDDMVLPAATRQRIEDVLAAIRARELVYERWGFTRHGHAAAGLCILFSGVSGVGKTATAAALAAELDGQELYRVDLAAVVSKYIGETEKNLDRIFEAARGCDALMLFDEADALFGKRSEVKDAHDRYANLETAYLLQKMEAHDGVSILATNLARNIDAAFARRIHYAVEFPRPDAGLRLQLWQRLLQGDAPLGGDIDLGFLAERFDLTGGDIRAATLDAAFLAAAGRGVIGMRELVRAVARVMAKHGRPVQRRDFRPYDELFGPS